MLTDVFAIILQFDNNVIIVQNINTSNDDNGDDYDDRYKYLNHILSLVF